jgi:hypothetical protein
MQVNNNPIRYTAEAAIILHGLDGGWLKFLEALRKCERRPGLYIKRPGNTSDQVTGDDLIPLMHLCIKTGIRSLVFKHLVSHFGFYINTDKWVGFRSFLGRNIPLWVMSAYAAGKKPWWILRFISSKYVSSSGNQHTQDEWVLSWHVLSALKTRCDLHAKEMPKWEQRFKNNWPGGFKDLLTKYYAHEHPLAMYWPHSGGMK